jgi:type II secretory pathway pseudopilin PulG
MKKAFTVLEAVIILAIIAMFFTVSIPFFSRLTKSAKLDTSARSVASTLRLAREYAISTGNTYYVVFDISTTPDEYYIYDGTNIIEKKYKLPTGCWFYNMNATTDPFAEAIEFTGDRACFKPTGELDESAAGKYHVYIADGNSDTTAKYQKEINVEKTTGRVKVD